MPPILLEHIPQDLELQPVFPVYSRSSNQIFLYDRARLKKGRFLVAWIYCVEPPCLARSRDWTHGRRHGDFHDWSRRNSRIMIGSDKFFKFDIVIIHLIEPEKSNRNTLNKDVSILQKDVSFSGNQLLMRKNNIAHFTSSAHWARIDK